MNAFSHYDGPKIKKSAIQLEDELIMKDLLRLKNVVTMSKAISKTLHYPVVKRYTKS